MNNSKRTTILAITYLPNDSFWLKDELDKLDYETKLIFTNRDNSKSSLSFKEMIKSNMTSIYLGFKVYRKYQSEDVVIFWTYLAGFIFAILDLFKRKTNKDTKIIALHMLVIKVNLIKKTIIRLVSFLASLNPRLIVTVNSESEKKSFSRDYFVDIKKVRVLPDSISDKTFHNFKKGDGRVFCGGDNSRDWKTFFKVVEMCPKIKFVAIARKRNFNYFNIIPNNCQMYFDTDSDFFYDTIIKCSIVAIPLSSNFASGLIVIGKTAALSKPVIITETSCTVNYIENQVTGILIGQNAQTEDWVREINVLSKDLDLQKDLATSFSNFMRLNHSQNEYAKKILKF